MRRHTEYQNWVAVYAGLSPVQQAELDAHIQKCQVCASDLAAYRQMDADICSLRDMRAGAGVRVRFTEMVTTHATLQTPPLRRSIPKEPVMVPPRRVRQPWTPRQLLAPAGALVLFIAAVWLGMRVPDRPGPAVEPAAAVPPASAAITEINFQCERIMEWEVLSRVISDFEAQNLDVKVKHTPVDIFGTNEASYSAAVKQAAETADVYCAMPSPTHLQIGAARDLAPFIAADASFQPDDFYPGLLFRWGEGTGPILAVPTYFDLGLIAYKPAAFDEAGLPYPQPGWTWEDFLRVVLQLTQRQGDEVVRWGFSDVGTGLINRRLMSAWSSDWQAGPDYATLANVLAWYETLYVQTQAAPAPITLGWEEGKTHSGGDLDPYRNGNKSALWDASRSGTASVGLRVPYPESRPGEPQQPMSTLAGLVMSGETAHPEASWRWISYLSQHLPDAEHIQARRSLAEVASFWSKLDPANTAAYRYALDHLAVFPGRLPSDLDYVAQMEAVVAVVKGEKTAVQALADLAAQGHMRGAPGTPAPLVTPPPMPTVAPEAVAAAVSAQPAVDLLSPTNGLTHTWRDYETALVRAILPVTLAHGVCDWQVLGHTGQDVYVWAFCAARQPAADIAAASVPAVLSLADDGHTVTARLPRDGTYYPEDIRAMFPAAVQQMVFDRPSTETPARLEQHARRRLTLSTLPPLGAAETVTPRPEVSATGAHIALYSGRADPRWDLNELDLAQLDALLEGLPAIDCPPMPDQLGYRGVVVNLGHADESRMTAFNSTLWFGYAGANPQAICLSDSGRSVERFLLGSAQPYLEPQVFNALTAGLALPVPTPLVTPSPTPTQAPGFVRDADECFGIQFAAAGWELCQVTGLSGAYCVAGPPTENPVAPPAFYFTVLPPGFMNEDASAYNWWSPDELTAAFAADIGEQFTSPRAPAGYEEHHRHARLADATVDGFSAIVVENERPWGIAVGTKDRRVLIRLGKGALVLGTYYRSGEDLQTFEEVVTSFRIGTALRVKANKP